MGTSLLFVYDAASPSGATSAAAAAGRDVGVDGEEDGDARFFPVEVRMIDFAKTTRLPDGAELSHRAPWVHGNREDGYLTGLDSIISVFEAVGSESGAAA